MDSTRFDSQIQVIAKRLADGDSFLAEELRSEMHIAVMEQMRISDSVCMDIATVAAKAYLSGKSHTHRKEQDLGELRCGYCERKGHVYNPKER